MESSYVGAYWGSRRESALECGERLARCITALASADVALGAWFRRGATKAAANTPVGRDALSLAALLGRGRDRRDFGSAVIEELGYSIGLWNRARPEVGLSGTVGAYPSFKGVLNSFVLELPPPDDESGRLYLPEVAVAIFEAVVESWEPDWATWTTHGLRDGQTVAARELVVGWFTYLRDGASEELPGVSSWRLARGSVIQAEPDFAAVDEVVVRKVRNHLEQAAALRPIP